MDEQDGRRAGRGKRVALLGSYAPSLINFRGPLISALVADGHEVFALAPDIDAPTADRLRALGAHPFSVRLGRTSLNPWGGMRTVGALRRLFRTLRPDVLIAYTIKPVVLGAAAARMAGVPSFVAMITGMGYSFVGGREPRRLLARAMAILMYRRALRRARMVIFQNEDDRRDFRRLGMLAGGVPTGMVNGSGVDLDHFAVVPLPPGPSFLMIGRFLRDKGVREYAEAAARLKRDFPAVRIALVGWADESPDSLSAAEMEALIRSGIDNLGHLEDVRPAIAGCSVYVLPSYREGTPRSVLEAMAMGRAVITTDAPGCRETVVEGDNGFLVPPRDSEALYRAMRRFVDEPALCAAMGMASRRLAERRFDVRKVNRAIIEHAGL